MKLLGWMPRKFKQQSIDTLKNFTLGNSCTCLSARPLLEEQRCYQQPIMCQKSPIGVKVNKDEEVLEEEESSITMSSLFHGFLAIGTLGSDPISTEPPTPKFAISFENVIEKETEVTNTELKIINDELEKFLEAEAEEESNEYSESSERSSYASIITLSGTKIDVLDAEEYENTVVCPLQGYLFGSSIELPETGVKKEKTSLGELFKNNNNLSNEQNKGTDKGEEKRSKGTHGTHFMKKMFKKLHSSSKSTASVTSDAADSVSSKRKLPKVLRMFHRKIHPEKSPAEKKFTKSQENNRLRSINSTGNGEHWIKTDADYLVLEL